MHICIDSQPGRSIPAGARRSYIIQYTDAAGLPRASERMVPLQACVYDEYGAPEVMTVRRVLKPVAKAEEVLVRVRAAGVSASSRFGGFVDSRLAVFSALRRGRFSAILGSRTVRPSGPARDRVGAAEDNRPCAEQGAHVGKPIKPQARRELARSVGRRGGSSTGPLRFYLCERMRNFPRVVDPVSPTRCERQHIPASTPPLSATRLNQRQNAREPEGR